MKQNDSQSSSYQYLQVITPSGTQWICNADRLLMTLRPQDAQPFTKEEAHQTLKNFQKLGYKGLSLVDSVPSVSTHVTNRPLAAAGLLSYRARSRYGWVMIGAHNTDDALVQALRSNTSATIADLEQWNGSKYIPINGAEHSVDPLGQASVERPRA